MTLPVRSETTIDDLSTDAFVGGWQRITGEPPSVLLADRREMIALLVDSVPLPDDSEGGRPSE